MRAVLTQKNNYHLLQVKEHIFAGLALLLALAIGIILGFHIVEGIKAQPRLLRIFLSRNSLPAEKKIYSIIEPLRYSGLEMIKQEHVSIRADFSGGFWVLEHLHQFDAQGNLALAQERFGTCLELASYTYNKIKPILGSDYEVSFLNAAQSGYFPYPLAAHTVLGIRQVKGGAEYILDPSFCRYGTRDDFKDYLFLREIPRAAENAAQPDALVPLNAMFPLLIKNDYLIGIIVEENDGGFNRDNFVLALKAVKKYNFSSDYLFALRKNQGRGQALEMNTDLGKRLLGEEEYRNLCQRMRVFFKEMQR